jgi:transcriptional regulator with XRE-family HTH domain
MDISKTIKDTRESKRLTQTDIAERLLVSQSNYAYLESRNEKLTIEQLANIANALGVSVLELIGEKQAVQSADVKTLQNEVARLQNENVELSKQVELMIPFITYFMQSIAKVGSLIGLDKDKEPKKENISNEESIEKAKKLYDQLASTKR